ncbi:hypothetical protein DPMN_112110 [Dreissena polymorpha]|uniref:RING-type domain-containing protein n=1 Tax=Dreissena polymorpha TaxID=45954 RepID=A0A9D4QQD0_DREPO|nr:hypothetical protein DPMN_112110 [Dreissena polymorpha]
MASAEEGRDFKDSMKYESARLRSFIGYPRDGAIFAIRYAKAGLYYKNEGGYEVHCYCCGVTIPKLSEFDNPAMIHRNMSRNCPFFTRNPEVNVSVTNDEEKCGNFKLTSLLTSLNQDLGYLERGMPPSGAAQRVTTTTRNNEQPIAGASNAQSEAARELLLKKKKLIRENKRLKMAEMCVVCLRQETSIVFLPCGHLITCEDCGKGTHMRRCELCKTVVKGACKVYKC